MVAGPGGGELDVGAGDRRRRGDRDVGEAQAGLAVKPAMSEANAAVGRRQSTFLNQTHKCVHHYNRRQ